MKKENPMRVRITKSSDPEAKIELRHEVAPMGKLLLKDSNKAINLLNELDSLINTIGITYDLGNKRGHEIIAIVKDLMCSSDLREGE